MRYGDADGLMPREHRELRHAVQLLGGERQDHLCDDERDDEPVQNLGDGAPAER